ncbi:hypothetical protein PM082_024600 [Marasmius tenuissimus]|nr:hypothetical protein PM082_024600 [Marasmius tenuissimus]
MGSFLYPQSLFVSSLCDRRAKNGRGRKAGTSRSSHRSIPQEGSLTIRKGIRRVAAAELTRGCPIGQLTSGCLPVVESPSPVIAISSAGLLLLKAVVDANPRFPMSATSPYLPHLPRPLNPFGVLPNVIWA